MKRTLFICPFLFYVMRMFSQTCDCAMDFKYLRNYMETNHPGLNSDQRKNGAIYKNAANEIQSRITQLRPSAECILYLQEYFDLLNDHHISIRTNIPVIKTISAPVELDSFFLTNTYREAMKVEIDSSYLMNFLIDKPIDQIEGIYKDFNGRLIAIIKDSINGWNYKGIVITPVKMFSKGIVKFLFQPTSQPGKYRASVLLQDFQKVYTTVTLENGSLPYIGLMKLNTTSKELIRNNSLFEFKSISDQTNYLRVNSFQGHLQSTLDSFYKSIDGQIGSKPNLIIDVRNNGGGSETNYYRLIKYLYTGTIYPDNFQVFVTTENLLRYKEFLAMMKADAGHYSSALIQNYESTIEKMEKAKPNTFMYTTNRKPRLLGKYQEFPKRIVILTNRVCASACEVFVFNASQSKKVETMGENTGGYMGFGNVLPFKTPCYGFTFYNTTTRYLKNHQYEFIGIAPKIRLSDSEDWILAAMERLERK